MQKNYVTIESLIQKNRNITPPSHCTQRTIDYHIYLFYSHQNKPLVTEHFAFNSTDNKDVRGKFNYVALWQSTGGWIFPSRDWWPGRRVFDRCDTCDIRYLKDPVCTSSLADGPPPRSMPTKMIETGEMNDAVADLLSDVTCTRGGERLMWKCARDGRATTGRASGWVSPAYRAISLPTSPRDVPLLALVSASTSLSR